MADEKWIIYWDEYNADTYIYGSEIRFHRRDDVEYKNSLIPPGTVIKQWYSKTNFQRQHREPSLPMIDGEGCYSISIHMDLLPGESALVRLVFYDRYDNEVGYFNVRGNFARFQCPLKTYSYTLQLINSGVTHFHFHSIVMQENEVEKTEE